MKYKEIELLAPAGDMERLKMSVAYGANAVYLAGNAFGMRAAVGNFSEEELRQAVAYCHARNVRVHVTCNTMPRNAEIAMLPQWMEQLQDAGVDAVILADLGVLELAKKYAPKVEAHISTQASIVNYAAAEAFYNLGAKRVILARELSLPEIAEVRAKTSKELEMEVFVHGSMCVSYSGRCLLSNYMSGRDSNRGACSQPCRYGYALMEERRPGVYFPIEEENGETHIMNSKDMCMIDHVEELMALGLDSLKIEGRAKSSYYAGIITGAYRHAIDAVQKSEPLEPIWRNEVDAVSHRHYSTGFFYDQPGQYTESSAYLCAYQIVAMVTDCDAEGNATLSLRNKFNVGTKVNLVGPNVTPEDIIVDALYLEDGESVDEVRNPQMVFKMKFPRQVPPLSVLRRPEA